jgi:predicted aminopeptidase
MKLGWHRAAVAYHSVAIQEVLESPSVDSQVKEKIRFIREVKRYGEEGLGLKRTKSFTTYFEPEGPILQVITTCEKDRFQLRTWSFPLVGEVTYKGFFTEEDANREKRLLEEEDLDTIIQPACAYSTLGWLKDPIYSSLLGLSHAALAGLILHEMTHATVYFRGDTGLNEQLATFIGNRGAIAFLMERFGADSEEVREAIAMQEDDLLFSGWIDRSYEQLSSLYAGGLSREAKLREREKIFSSLKEDFRAIRGQFQTNCYPDMEKVDLNNAALMAYWQYFHGLDRFEVLYQGCGRDLRKVVEGFKEMRRSGQRPAGF